MKKAIILPLLICYAFFLDAQNIKAVYGPMLAQKSTASMVDAYVYGNTVFTIQKMDGKGKNMQFIMYDINDLTVKKQVQFKKDDCDGSRNCIDKHYGYTKTLYFKDKIVLFFENYDRKNDEHWLWAQKIDLDGKFIDKVQKVDKIDATRKNNAGSFYIEPSADSNSFVIITNPPFDKYEDEKFNFSLFDSNLNPGNSASLSLPVKDKNLGLQDYYLGNDGKVYILAHISIEKKEREKGQARSYYTIFTIDPATKNVSEFKLNLDKRDVMDVSIRLDDENGKVLCAGFYSDLRSKSTTGNDIDGFFYMTVDMATEKIDKLGTKKIESKIIQELMSRRRAKAGKGLSNCFDILKIRGNSNGSTTIIAEHRWIEIVTTTTTTSSGTSTKTDYHYYNYSIFIINVDSEGQVESLVTIPKKQHTVNDYGIYNSIMIMEKGDRLVLVYNDHPDNVDNAIDTQRETSTMRNIRKALLIAAEVYNDGHYTKREIQDNTQTKNAVLPRYGFQMREGEYIVTAVKVPAMNCACMLPFMKFKRGLVTLKLE